MNLMQGGVLIFHTRAVTWGLGFSCLVQFSACQVVKAKYLLLFICFRMLQCTYLKTPRIGFLTQSFPPRGKLPSFFPHFIGGECLHFEYFQSGAFLENGPRKIPQDYQSSNLPQDGVLKSIVRFYESLIFTAKFNHDEVLNQILNQNCIWILVIKFSYFSDYGHPSHVDERRNSTQEQIPAARCPDTGRGSGSAPPRPPLSGASYYRLCNYTVMRLVFKKNLLTCIF